MGIPRHECCQNETSGFDDLQSGQKNICSFHLVKNVIKWAGQQDNIVMIWLVDLVVSA